MLICSSPRGTNVMASKDDTKRRQPAELTPQEAGAKLFARRFLNLVDESRYRTSDSWRGEIGEDRPSIFNALRQIAEEADEHDTHLLEVLQACLVGTHFFKETQDLTDSELMALFYSMLNDGYHTPSIKISLSSYAIDNGPYVCSYEGLDGAVTGNGTGASISEAILDAIQKVAKQMRKIDKVLRRYLDQAKTIQSAKNVARISKHVKSKK
jgi:hypothetical protein